MLWTMSHHVTTQSRQFVAQEILVARIFGEAVTTLLLQHCLQYCAALMHSIDVSSHATQHNLLRQKFWLRAFSAEAVTTLLQQHYLQYCEQCGSTCPGLRYAIGYSKGEFLIAKETSAVHISMLLSLTGRRWLLSNTNRHKHAIRRIICQVWGQPTTCFCTWKTRV